MAELDPEIKQQIDEQSILRNAHKRRLFVLQEKAANLGLNTPPEIQVEITDIEQQIQKIDTTITSLYITAARRAERHQISEMLLGDNPNATTGERISALGRYIMYVEDKLAQEIAEVYRIFDTWKSGDSVQRVSRQKKLDFFLYIITLLLVVLIVISFTR